MKQESFILQIRDFGDGTWSVMARVWNPQKMFYEHPTLINLTKEEAERHCNNMIYLPPSLEEIIETWEFIGN